MSSRSKNNGGNNSGGGPPGDNGQKGASGYKNEYIPNFISKKPFYLESERDADYLGHQRLQSERDEDLLKGDKWYDRGKKGITATKYRKGACENCGSMTHKKKDCLQRPRKTGAKFSGQDIAADEVIQEVQLGWDGKRDRWNGYDASEHDVIVQEHERLEELRLESKEAEGRKRLEDGNDENDEKYAEESEVPGQGYDSSQRISTRNLRIREDKAKYLLNLDLDSAKYDPKTRTMVDGGALSDQAAALVAEEGFMRSSGEAAEFERAQKLAWETRERGDMTKMHLQANPTEGEILRRKMEAHKEDKTSKQKSALLAKYGGEEHLQAPPIENSVIESERYVEYSPSGQLVKGKTSTIPKSKYKEDIFNNNHTSVWGSWWSNFRWGYACCRSHVKNSYCTGEEGIRGFEEAERLRTGGQLELLETKQVEWRKDDETEQAQVEQKRDEERDDDRAARAKADKKETEEDRKRKRDQLLGGVTEEDMENHRRKKTMFDDPMANYIDTGA